MWEKVIGPTVCVNHENPTQYMHILTKDSSSSLESLLAIAHADSERAASCTDPDSSALPEEPGGSSGLLDGWLAESSKAGGASSSFNKILDEICYNKIYI